MSNQLIVVRGDGRIIKGLSVSETVEQLRIAQQEHDRYATVIGWVSAGLDIAALEAVAGYQGATEEECLSDLERLAAKVTR
jgi:hypothetical protein